MQRMQPMQIPLEKGYSQMDWLRLCRSGADLSGLKKGPPRKGITLEEVRRHNSREDAWMVIHGKVRSQGWQPGGAPT